MKVFISHKREDSHIAVQIKNELDRLQVSAYLDVLDDGISGKGKALTEHIKKQLNSCTDLIVVMSGSTYKSWWVPFEIGMSAQKDMPTVTFLSSTVSLPDYLEYWPRLRSTLDIGKYVKVRKQYTNGLTFRGLSESMRMDSASIPDFYEKLKRELR